MPTGTTPQPGQPGYIAPNTGLLSVGQAGAAPIVAGYTPSTAQASTATSTSYDPSAFAVTPDQTVQSQVEKIVSGDSALMQQARTRANQDAQAKGLLNSSLAVEAGQNAVISQALPIATQDAATYNRAMTDTANAENAAKHFGAGASNQASITNAGLLTNTGLANAESANTAKREGAAAFNQASLQAMDAQTRTALATLDVQNRQLLQASQTAQNMFQQTLVDITSISTNPSLTEEAKDAAIATQLEMLREGLALTGHVATTEAAAVTSLDLEQYFEEATTNPPGTAPGTVVSTPGTFTPQPQIQPAPTAPTNRGQMNSLNPPPRTAQHPQPWVWKSAGRDGWWE